MAKSTLVEVACGLQSVLIAMFLGQERSEYAIQGFRLLPRQGL